ncbi:carboxylesterase family protein [Paraburkholderia terrae]|uniref:Carboxylic ester hydrolase n=1 Tax=Paraburkholderia terrae TaxID=311230 RepID=A0A2I8F0S8_9BURK|nr:carboxylesterase family protein [Paraburkholderia terrae]AUT65475.1 hypothetical protein C2L65_38755 [Paraburkholderia terrae]
MKLQSQIERPVSKTASGQVRGVARNGAAIWLGIPYGRAQGHAGAFSPVEAVEPWDGYRDCADKPAVFFQSRSRLASIMGDSIDEYRQSDDAFTVNVFAPQDAHGLPVLVFIHGGAFGSGGGTHWYNAEHLAVRGNLVVVTINYRLGMWGNIAHPDAPTNNALRDVVAALKWLNENISAFGGDAANVTLSGQSAGAAITRLLTLTPSTKGLFQRAIMISYPGRITAAASEMREVTGEVMASLQLTSVAELARRPAHDILAATATVAQRRKGPIGPGAPVFRPYVDDDLLFDWVDDIDQSVSHAHCTDVIAGFTKDEIAAFVWERAEKINDSPATVVEWFKSAYGSHAAAAYDLLASKRPGATPYSQLVDGMSDLMFARPAVEIAKTYGRAGTAWLYRFDVHTAQSFLMAPHCMELPFFFDNLADWNDAPMLQGLSESGLQSLATRFSRCIVNFVRHGDPTLPGWNPFSEAHPGLTTFDLP